MTLTTAGNNTFTLTATGGSGTIDYVFQTSSDGCSISGDTLSFIGATVPTNCVVTAYNPANGVYAASATSASVTFTFTAEAPESGFDHQRHALDNGYGFTLTATGGSGTIDYVFQTSSAGCSISGDTLLLTGSAPTSCVVTAYNPANGVYAASATSASVTFNFISPVPTYTMTFAGNFNTGGSTASENSQAACHKR